MQTDRREPVSLNSLPVEMQLSAKFKVIGFGFGLVLFGCKSAYIITYVVTVNLPKSAGDKLCSINKCVDEPVIYNNWTGITEAVALAESFECLIIQHFELQCCRAHHLSIR